ncbi:MAG: DUF924 domain-containing protein [Myxococcales bacterium]|nr:DUF924 domain-containing protein [Myxococcales bacterium]
MAIDELWTTWFGELDDAGAAAPAVVARWWRKDPAFDAALTAQFAPLHRAVVDGAHEAWRATARGAVAYVVVLDQLSRHMFRGTPAMYASDAQALAAAKDAVARGFDRAVPAAARDFLYLPYMHSEALTDQDACVALFADVAGAAEAVDFAERHRVIIRRFGRFPHRNQILGRASTAEEQAFLLEPGSSF